MELKSPTACAVRSEKDYSWSHVASLRQFHHLLTSHNTMYGMSAHYGSQAKPSPSLVCIACELRVISVF